MILSTTDLENKWLIFGFYPKKLFTISIFRHKKSGKSRFFKRIEG
ncbi:glucose-inhibited division protein A [Vibrio chagasii]|uniref:Glucose-inhibited division protein A n=1 Tax=Vibrio chagasii TaxID=170679 RepID=A0A2S7V709_9VIBR|nr:glucose-inhibited division protein A [Vibrio chagasii]PQJ58026.1 glucose-inhibited division protein A [Vibrio chagasii]